MLWIEEVLRLCAGMAGVVLRYNEMRGVLKIQQNVCRIEDQNLIVLA